MANQGKRLHCVRTRIKVIGVKHRTNHQLGSRIAIIGIKNRKKKSGSRTAIVGVNNGRSRVQELASENRVNVRFVFLFRTGLRFTADGNHKKHLVN